MSWQVGADEHARRGALAAFIAMIGVAMGTTRFDLYAVGLGVLGLVIFTAVHAMWRRVPNGASRPILVCGATLGVSILALLLLGNGMQDSNVPPRFFVQSALSGAQGVVGGTASIATEPIAGITSPSNPLEFVRNLDSLVREKNQWSTWSRRIGAVANASGLALLLVGVRVPKRRAVIALCGIPAVASLVLLTLQDAASFSAAAARYASPVVSVLIVVGWSGIGDGGVNAKRSRALRVRAGLPWAALALFAIDFLLRVSGNIAGVR
jgi:hypothetical protein